MTLVLSVLEQGMIYAIMALGIYITYTILDFPDLTVDGSFPLGAAISAVLITKGVNPILTLLISFLAGVAAGTLTGLIHVKLKVRDLLSGIIMMTALYTVNLRIAGRANVPIYNMTTLFDNALVKKIFTGSLAPFANTIIILVITLIMKFLLDWYMSTKSGYLLRAVGDNETIVTSMGVDKGVMKIIGLAIANGLVTLSGCIFAQQQRYFDISMGTGTMVIGLASVIIGISLLKKVSFIRVTTSVIIGSIIYKACVAIAIKLGMAAFYHALGRRVQSGVLEASAKDSRNDCVATGSTILALLAALVTDWPVDGIIGIFVSILILKTGYDIIRDTMDDLLGRPADPELVKQIHEMLAEEPHILGIHDLMLHNYGPGHVIGSCHAEVRSDENFAQIHDVIDRAEREIQEKLGILMTIHMDPLELDNALVVQCAQQVREIIHGLDPNLSMHDFRLIAGERERNFIFDLVVPFDCMYENEELQELIEAALNEMEPVLCHAVITFDRDFAA